MNDLDKELLLLGKYTQEQEMNMAIRGFVAKKMDELETKVLIELSEKENNDFKDYHCYLNNEVYYKKELIGNVEFDWKGNLLTITFTPLTCA